MRFNALKKTPIPKITLILGFGLLMASCSPQEQTNGLYRVELSIQNQQLPFVIELKNDSVFLINGAERLAIETLTKRKDSFAVELLSFNAELVFKLQNQQIEGYWRKLDAADYIVKLRGQKSSKPRFAASKPREFSGKFEVQFTKPDGNTYPALGIFYTEAGELRGTFLTNSGDYRFLAGVADADSLKLSCFDGTHAYLFEAAIKGDSLLEGRFWSGKSRMLTWTARRNDNFALADPATLTYLKDSTQPFEFSFPDLSGRQVALKDYFGKVVVVQILGSWCPNCMDETRFLAQFHRLYQQKGFEVLGLAFETAQEIQNGGKMLSKFKQKLQADYPMLLCGTPEKALEALPTLNRVSSFPTTIFVDKKGKVRHIHTGFSGPATGGFYQDFVEEFTERIEKLLTE